MTPRKILLVGWDAADWKVIHPLMAAGKMPTIQRLVRNGASGQIATLHPPLSPMLWTSIATGKRPFKHGIHGFSEPAPDGSGARPVTNLSRTCKTLWNIFTQSGLRSTVIGWWPSHPAEPIDGVMVSDLYHRAAGPLESGWPLPPHTVYPAELAHPLADLRVHPDCLTPPIVEAFIPLAKEIDQDRDPRMAALLRTLAECMSIQAAAMWLLDHQPWDFFAVYFEALDHFCHSFMRYHPPRQQWIAERDFELYHNVVSMAYQLHDQMLGSLIEKAGPDATAILMSDHGFHPDHLRPSSIPDIPAGPAIEHRPFGILAISGPGIREGQPLQGASVLDVAPTILALYGLPVGQDMDGKVLSQAFVPIPEISFVPSWEEIPGADGRHPHHTRLDPVAAHAALEQMIALGYIERPHHNPEVAIVRTIRELRYNLGEAYQDGGRHAEAREIFAELHRAEPEEPRFAVRLFVSCQALSLQDEMQRIVEENTARYPQALIDYLKAQVLVAGKHYAEALAVLQQLSDAQPNRPALFMQVADLHLRLHREGQARRVYHKVLALDPDCPAAYIGLCRIELRQRKFGAASRSALDALQRTHHDPLAHFLLGRALAGMKEYERAAEAFRAALSLNPNFPEAHARLAVLFEKHLGDHGSSREHHRLARSMTRRGKTHPAPEIETAVVESTPDAPGPPAAKRLPPAAECLVIVTGLPRSGTSLMMQMLAAGGMSILTDEWRAADEDNPRGYLEFEPVKNLLNDAKWLFEARGKAVKIVAPLLAALPPGLPCRAILCERDLDEVLDSQERMLERRSHPTAATPERRRMLKDEYRRILARVKATLAARPDAGLLVIEHRFAISDPLVTAETINRFLGDGLDVARMAAAVEPTLHRNRARTSR